MDRAYSKSKGMCAIFHKKKKGKMFENLGKNK